MASFAFEYFAPNLLGHLILHWWGYQLISFAYQISAGDLSPAAVRNLAVPSLSRLWFELFRPFFLLICRQVFEEELLRRFANEGTVLETYNDQKRKLRIIRKGNWEEWNGLALMS